MPDSRLLPAAVADLSGEAWNEMAERIGTLDVTPVLVYLIDAVPAAALPALADQFSVPAFEWRLARTDAARRDVVKTAIERRRIKGTPGAIETGLSVLGLSGLVQEWFEYGGDPGHFRVEIYLDTAGIDDETGDDLSAMVDAYKRMSAWLDEINYITLVTSGVPAYSVGCTSAEITAVYPE